jgi:hypothetical protein
VNQWTEEDWNAQVNINIENNGFVSEFRQAMANLQANNVSGIASRRGSFAYFGRDRHESAADSPRTQRIARRQQRRRIGTNWTNNTFASRLVAAYPRPFDAATDLDGNATRRANALRAGLPANLFVVNPAVGEANVFVSDAFSDYTRFQVGCVAGCLVDCR